jgi:3-oxoacyl-[acyl-carrier-protein] synthase-1
VREVVVTGLGIVSCLGNEPEQVVDALRHGRSGITYCDEYADIGMRSRVHAIPDISREAPIDRKFRRFMGTVSEYAYHAMQKAVHDAGLSPRHVSDVRTGLIVGAGTGSLSEYVKAIDLLRSKGIRKVPPYTVPKTMASSVSACLTTAFGIKGHSYSLTAACASSAHCIGQASDLIRSGRQDVVFAGGSEEAEWTSAAMFDAMNVLSTGFNSTPQTASRPYDAARDGFVMGGGAGIIVLEERKHAEARNAHIYAELDGYGASSDSPNLVNSTIEGSAMAMHLALADAKSSRVDLVNTHAISTMQGDVDELLAIKKIFKTDCPRICSTKGLTGHSLAASGVHSAIFSILMMDRGFISACANLQVPDPRIAEMPLVSPYPIEQKIDSIMINSLGFGGSNASLVFRKN